jgi:hypothetical protein
MYPRRAYPSKLYLYRPLRAADLRPQGRILRSALRCRYIAATMRNGRRRLLGNPSLGYNVGQPRAASAAAAAATSLTFCMTS